MSRDNKTHQQKSNRLTFLENQYDHRKKILDAHKKKMASIKAELKEVTHHLEQLERSQASNDHAHFRNTTLTSRISSMKGLKKQLEKIIQSNEQKLKTYTASLEILKNKHTQLRTQAHQIDAPDNTPAGIASNKQHRWRPCRFNFKKALEAYRHAGFTVEQEDSKIEKAIVTSPEHAHDLKIMLEGSSMSFNYEAIDITQGNDPCKIASKKAAY